LAHMGCTCMQSTQTDLYMRITTVRLHAEVTSVIKWVPCHEDVGGWRYSSAIIWHQTKVGDQVPNTHKLYRWLSKPLISFHYCQESNPDSLTI
jgi:hypothetical protein